MQVLSGRAQEKFVLPGFHTTIHVVSVQSGTVRLGIEAPEEVRVLREQVPHRESEWGADPNQATNPPTLLQLNQLVERRLEITRRGLEQLRQRLACGEAEDAAALLDKVDEDLSLLRRRMRHEVEKAAPADAEMQHSL